MNEPQARDAYLLFSEATMRLTNAMFGGLRRGRPVRRVNKICGSELSVGYAGWRAKAASDIVAAARKGILPIYLMPALGPRRGPQNANILRLPQKILQRLPTPRDGFSDHAVRPS